MADEITAQSSIVKGIDVSDIHVDTPLSNLSIAYMQDQSEFIASKWFPIINVNQISGSYYKYALRTFFESPSKKWTPGAKMPGGAMDMDTKGTYSCQFRAYEYPLPAHLAAAQDSMVNLERAITEKVTRALLLDQEIQVAGDFFATGKWTEYTGASSGSYTYWDDYANSDPLANILYAKMQSKAGSGMTPNTLVINEQVYEALRLHPQLKEIYKYTQAGIITEELMARALGVDKILVGKAIYMSSVEGAADVLSYVWNRSAWVGYVAPNVGLMTPTAGAIFSYTGMTGGYSPAIERVPDRRTHADYFQGYTCYDDKLISTLLGRMFYLITSA